MFIENIDRCARRIGLTDCALYDRFLIPIGVIAIIYWFAGLFYRSSARELKRLDAILRSSLYAHFSESLSGLSTIRAYGELGRFHHENELRMNNENR
jgi:ABC-type multidrug transport system fused ATPase/permease subunit